MTIYEIGKIFRRLLGSRGHRPTFIQLRDKSLSQNERASRFVATYNARRGLPAGKLSHDLLSREDVARLVDAPFDEALVKLGFQRASHKTWVRRDLAPICHLFSLTRYGSTGYGIAPSFGISLDFVPHISAGRIHWHRTVKSARFDLCVETQSRWFGTNSLGPEQKVVADVNFMLPRAMKMANEFWGAAQTLEEVSRLFSDYDRFAGRRFKVPVSKLPNFVRPSPAEAFVTAKIGSLEEARKLLDQWLEVEERVSPYRLDTGVKERLHRLLLEANAKENPT